MFSSQTVEKKHSKKLLRKTQIHFFSFAALTAKTSQAEEIMFQNVAYRQTVYRTGSSRLFQGRENLQRKYPLDSMLFKRFEEEIKKVIE